MGLTRYEQETIINFNEEEDFVTIYTASKRSKREIEKKGFVQYKDPILNRKTKKPIAWFFKGPIDRFSFTIRKRRTTSAIQREKLRQQAIDNFSSKNQKQGK